MRIADLRSLVASDMAGLVARLQEVTGRRGQDEADAWSASLPVVGQMFAHEMFQPLHLYFGEKGHLSLEYRLPASSSWCDMVLLGAHQGKPAAAILELKHWDTWSDRPGILEGLVERRGDSALHPSDQVRGYVDYCRNFHSTVLAEKAGVHGCVVFTKDQGLDAYRQAPNEALTNEYPCFSAFNAPQHQFVEYFAKRLSEPAPEFAASFELGRYEQDRGFVYGIANILSRSDAKGLVLLDNQRLGFALCRAEIQKALLLSPENGGKKVIIVEGPPGSGKSAIAAKVWADLAADSRFKRGRFVVTTTSTAQETNWKHLVESVTQIRGAEGVVLPANKYAPAQLQWLSKQNHEHPGTFGRPAQWRENLKALKREHGDFWMPDDHLEVSVVDEAHALINPEIPQAITHSGWPNPFGPQAYHIIRASRVSIFFLDQEQGFRERESTRLSDIRQWAEALGAEVAASICLADGQFRCGGSKEYVDWVEALLAGIGGAECAQLAEKWIAPAGNENLHKVAEEPASYSVTPLMLAPRRARTFEFKLCESPFELESVLRARAREGATTRLVASFARPWVTGDSRLPHDLPPQQQDFYFPTGDGKVWARPWNHIRDWDYSSFVQARPGTRMAIDPLAEVGCTYAVRGFDFDYVGVVWLEDLRWSGQDWHVDLAYVHETGLSKLLRSARRRNNPDVAARAEIGKRVARAYRILLTRAIKGVFVWCVDEGTSSHIEQALGQGTHIQGAD